MSLTKAKFTDKANVEITLQKPKQNDPTENQRPFRVLAPRGSSRRAGADRNKLTAARVWAMGRGFDDQASEACQERQQDTLPEAEEMSLCESHPAALKALQDLRQLI